MKNLLMLTATAATVSLGGVVAAQSETSQPLASPLTFDQAIAIALEAQPGTIDEVALERNEGKVVIEVEVATDTGQEVEFVLDAQSGEILEQDIDDDPSNDPDNDQESDDS